MSLPSEQPKFHKKTDTAIAFFVLAIGLCVIIPIPSINGTPINTLLQAIPFSTAIFMLLLPLAIYYGMELENELRHAEVLDDGDIHSPPSGLPSSALPIKVKNSTK